MLRLLTLGSFLLLSFWVKAQDNPVTWTFTLENKEGKYQVVADASIEEGWFVYSQFVGDNGPIPTSISLAETPTLVLDGKPQEKGNEVAGFDDVFGMELVKFKKQASFSQLFSLQEPQLDIIGAVEFMACNSKKCLPPSTVSFEIPVSN